MKDWIAVGNRNLMNTYNRFTVVITRGKGIHVWDIDGKRYLDFGADSRRERSYHSPSRITSGLRENL